MPLLMPLLMLPLCLPASPWLQGDWLNFNRFSLRAQKGLGLGPLR